MQGISAETHPLAWIPSKSELLSRPLETAYAIDPKNPVEIDDAIRVDRLSDRETEYRVNVFIADMGLIKGQGSDIDLARRRGWTRYDESGVGDHLTMFRESIWRPLGLDQRLHDVGAPAVRIAYTYIPRSRRIGEIDIDRVTLQSKQFTYPEAHRAVKDGHNDDLRLIAKVGNLMAKAYGIDSATKSYSIAKTAVAQHMVIANHVVSRHIDGSDLPWLNRNHGEKSLQKIDYLNQEEINLFKTMFKAIYQVTPTEHEGLGLSSYCHVTSGWRRFADAANGLNIDSMLDEKDPFYSKEDMEDISREIIEIYRKELIRAQRDRNHQAA